MKKSLLISATLATALLPFSGCNPPGQKSAGDAKSAGAGAQAARTYVAPGDKDEYYLFYSGGHSGQVYVAGIPSMRHISTIPVFAPYPATGYGFDEETKKMLGDYTWGDVHHPGLSKKDGVYDGRFLFVNDNANNRVARINLSDFKTHQILGPIPNSSGNHGSSFVTDNTEYVLVASRFSVPLPKGRYADPKDYEKEFNGMLSGIKVEPSSGEMSVGWQIVTPPFDWDLGSTGKGPSEGWAFWTSYNTEMAHETLEATSTQGERDYAAVVNWRAAEAAVKEGKVTVLDGVPVIDPAQVPGVLYFLPVPKSPHGIDTDPSGRWITASGKLIRLAPESTTISCWCLPSTTTLTLRVPPSEVSSIASERTESSSCCSLRRFAGRAVVGARPSGLGATPLYLAIAACTAGSFGLAAYSASTVSASFRVSSTNCRYSSRAVFNLPRAAFTCSSSLSRCCSASSCWP